MRLRRTGIALFAVVTLASTAGLARHARSTDVTAHEWGTFTTVAGAAVGAIEWLPLGGPTDLPCFVKHVRAAVGVTAPAIADTARRILTPVRLTKGEVVVGTTKPLTYEEARTQLWGKVRMETPVIYFYSPTAYDARVSVQFPRGVITEFYPSPVNTTAPFTTMTLRNPAHVHTVDWDVKVAPTPAEVFPNGGEASHYYAARATDATPIRVGAESEKFIFYRGVANFDVPIKALNTPGDSVLVVNLLGQGALPAVILFENRNGRMGFRSAGALAAHKTLARPALTSNVASIRAELHALLVSAGLYPKEATAMLDTWRDSWFEEGSRVFYLLPRLKVDDVLPLRITPAPASVARVFVGRMELIDRTTTRTVHSALEANDMATLARYARFLGPITDRIIAGGVDAATANRISVVANSTYEKYNRDSRVCE
jgi:hypothetical protein